MAGLLAPPPKANEFVNARENFNKNNSKSEYGNAQENFPAPGNKRKLAPNNTGRKSIKGSKGERITPETRALVRVGTRKNVKEAAQRALAKRPSMKVAKRPAPRKTNSVGEGVARLIGRMMPKKPTGPKVSNRVREIEEREKKAKAAEERAKRLGKN